MLGVAMVLGVDARNSGQGAAADDVIADAPHLPGVEFLADELPRLWSLEQFILKMGG